MRWLTQGCYLKADPGVDVFRNVAELVGESLVIIACGCLKEGKTMVSYRSMSVLASSSSVLAFILDFKDFHGSTVLPI